MRPALILALLLVWAVNVPAENEGLYDSHTGDLTLPAVVLKDQAYEIKMNYSKDDKLTVLDVTPAGQEPAYSELARAWGRIYFHWMFQGEWDLLWDHAAAPYQQTAGDKTAFAVSRSWTWDSGTWWHRRTILTWITRPRPR